MKLFDSIQVRAPKLNKFNLSHERMLSCDMGMLVPIMCNEVLPGDVWRVNTEMMCRLAPLLAPIMHRVNVKTEFFYVPTRTLWDEFEDFITGGRLGTSAPVSPYMDTDDMRAGGWFQNGTIADYFGLPTVTADNEVIKINALPFRAFQTIYNEYYRDQNLMADLDISKASGQITGAELAKICAGRQSCWEKDYFTSALPFAQRGAAVAVPLSDDATVQTKVYRVSTGTLFSEAGDSTIGNTGNALMTGSATQDGGAHYGAEGHGINVNELRRTIRLQEWLELAARAGGRYVEHLRAFWDQISDDARLQRPEFLSGASSPFRISEVLSTVQQVDPTTGDPVGTPQGDMAGHGISVGNYNGFKKKFKEHGYVIGIMRILPRTKYQQGVHRMWSRETKFDYAFHQFANIGEQAVLNKEVYYTGAAATNPSFLFGYQSRYAEYKFQHSSVHGDFKSTLDFWGMQRIFSGLPALDDTFVEADPTQRIFAVTNPEAHKVWVQVYNKVDVLRPLPYYGTPSI